MAVIVAVPAVVILPVDFIPPGVASSLLIEQLPFIVVNEVDEPTLTLIGVINNETGELIHQKELDKIVKILKKFPDLKVSIEGYVNGTDPSKNPNLDQLRANRAKDLLINRGISVNRISAKGMGTKYIVDKDELFTAPDGTQYNRNMRAIIKIYEN